MPKHRPIRFKDSGLSEEVRTRVKEFTEKHPIASSTASAVLASAIIGGVITVAAVAPGAVWLFGKTISARRREKRERYRRLWERFRAFKKRNVFELVGEDKEGGLIYRFTDKGRAMTRKFLLETIEVEPAKRWDGKWRIVIFDIPEKQKSKRRILQTRLDELGFYPLQKSVWIHPFPCENEISFLKDFLEVKPYVEVFTSEDMSNGKVLYYFRNLLKKHI